MNRLMVLCWPSDPAERDRLERALGAQRHVPFYAGSERGQCSRCGIDVWIAPRSQVAVANGALPLCCYCTLREAPDEMFSLGNPNDLGQEASR